MAAGTLTEVIYHFTILKSRGNAKNEAIKPFKYSYGWPWQCYRKLNFNETRKMLNLRKVDQRKGHLKDTNARGPWGTLRGITACQGPLKVKNLQTTQTSRCGETSPLQTCWLLCRRPSKLVQASSRRLREN